MVEACNINPLGNSKWKHWGTWPPVLKCAGRNSWWTDSDALLRPQGYYSRLKNVREKKSFLMPHLHQTAQCVTVTHCTAWLRDRAMNSSHTIYLSKHKLHLNQKKSSTKCWKCPHASRNPVQRICSDGNGSPDEIMSICLVQQNREMYP
jgi:hypothetical protein